MEGRKVVRMDETNKIRKAYFSESKTKNEIAEARILHPHALQEYSVEHQGFRVLDQDWGQEPNIPGQS